MKNTVSKACCAKHAAALSFRKLRKTSSTNRQSVAHNYKLPLLRVTTASSRSRANKTSHVATHESHWKTHENEELQVSAPLPQLRQLTEGDRRLHLEELRVHKRGLLSAGEGVCSSACDLLVHLVERPLKGRQLTGQDDGFWSALGGRR